MRNINFLRIFKQQQSVILTLQIPDINPSDQQLAQTIRIEIAGLLYQQGIWSMEQAARFAGMPYAQFQDILASKNIPLNYDEEDLEDDIESIKTLCGNQTSP